MRSWVLDWRLSGSRGAYGGICSMKISRLELNPRLRGLTPTMGCEGSFGVVWGDFGGPREHFP